MHSTQNRVFRVRDFQVDVSRRTVEQGEKTQYLRPRTFDLLVYLIENRGRLVTKDELQASLWPDTAVTDNSLVQCVVELRRALGDSAKDPQFLRTIPKLGYQFIAAAEEVGKSETHSAVEQADEGLAAGPVEFENPGLAPATGTTGSPRLRVYAAAAVAVILAAAGLTYWLTRDRGFVLPAVAGKSRIAVFHFENQSHSKTLEWMREGLADLVITNLGRSPKLTVLSRQQLHVWLEREGHSAGEGLTLEAALKLGSRAGAEILVLGSFAEFGHSLRINLQIHDAGGRLLGTETATADRPEQLLQQMDLLSIKLLTKLGAPPAPQRDTGGPLTRNLEAYRNYSLGVEQAQAYHSQEAIQLFERAIALDSGFAMAYARIGYTYSVIGASAEAGRPYLEKAFRLAEGLTPRDRMYVSAWYAVANLDFPGAVREFRQIVQRYPQEGEAYARLGQLLRGEEQFDEAISVLKAGLTADPEAQGIYNTLGGIYSQLRRDDEAIAMIERYVALAPSEPNAHDSLGLAYDWAGRFDDADRAFRRALELQPAFDVAVIHLAHLNFRRGRYREALRYCRNYRALASLDTTRARAYSCEAAVELRRNNLQSAEQNARQAIRFAPQFETTILIRVLAAQGRIREALAVRPTSPVPYSHRGARPPQRLYRYAAGTHALLAGNPAEAIAELQRAVRQWTGWAEMERFEDCLADAYLQLGRVDDAIVEYERVLAARPYDGRLHYSLGVAYRRKGQAELARAHFQRFLKMWEDADADGPELMEARTAL